MAGRPPLSGYRVFTSPRSEARPCAEHGAFSGLFLEKASVVVGAGIGLVGLSHDAEGFAPALLVEAPHAAAAFTEECAVVDAPTAIGLADHAGVSGLAEEGHAPQFTGFPIIPVSRSARIHWLLLGHRATPAKVTPWSRAYAAMKAAKR